MERREFFTTYRRVLAPGGRPPPIAGVLAVHYVAGVPMAVDVQQGTVCRQLLDDIRCAFGRRPVAVSDGWVALEMSGRDREAVASAMVGVAS